MNIQQPTAYDLKLECQTIVKNHYFLASGNIQGYIQGTEKMNNPKYPVNLLKQLCVEVKAIFEQEPIILKLNTPLVVIGDVHGHLFDLLRIFTNFGYPPAQRYLFLGDIIDRGEFNTECITLIYALKYLYPKHVYLIRGNHEFLDVAASDGFSIEISQLYPYTKVFNSFIESFEYIPLAAILFKKIICVHGGPCPELIKLAQIEEIQRPISEYNNPIICGILWSDPSDDVDEFLPSRRGTGWKFGNVGLSYFLEENNLSMCVRGHQCVQDGYESLFDGKLFTIFSASNYCGATNNHASVLIVHDSEKVEPVKIKPLSYIQRSNSRLVKPLTITDQQILDLELDALLRIPSLVISNIVTTEDKFGKKLNISQKLKSITRYRQISLCKSAPIYKISLVFPE